MIFSTLQSIDSLRCPLPGSLTHLDSNRLVALSTQTPSSLLVAKQKRFLAALLEELHNRFPSEPAALLRIGGESASVAQVVEETGVPAETTGLTGTSLLAEQQSSVDSGLTDSIVEDSSFSTLRGFPLGTPQQPLAHLDRVWRSNRGFLLGIEPRERTHDSTDAQSQLSQIFAESFQCLKKDGLLLLPLLTNETARDFAAGALEAGFEPRFLRVRCVEPVEPMAATPIHLVEEQPELAAALENARRELFFELSLEDALSPFQPSGAEIFAEEKDQSTVAEVPQGSSQHDSSSLNSFVTSEFLVLCARRKPFPAFSGTTRRKRAFVYNCYFDTGGGGERSSLDFAAALDELGYEVSLVSTRRIEVSLADLKASFGVNEHFSWPIRIFASEEDLKKAVIAEEVEVFVNHTFSSYMPNPAPIGIYLAMFPIPTLPAHIQHLLSYDRICCISEFTQEYVRRFWYQGLKTEVVYPPISAVHQAGDTGSFSGKDRLVLQIGRFNTEGHSKCQLEAIQTFCRLRRKNILGSNWSMKIVGRVNRGVHNERYIERCREEMQGENVEIVTNASLETIRDLYRRATCLWQFTGYGLDFGEAPQFCEHLGLVAMDCFSYGTLPMIYQRGGMVPLIRHGENGFCFGSQQELIELMERLAIDFKSPIHRAWYNSSLASAQRLSFSEYRDSIRNMLHSVSRTKKLSLSRSSEVGGRAGRKRASSLAAPLLARSNAPLPASGRLAAKFAGAATKIVRRRGKFANKSTAESKDVL